MRLIETTAELGRSLGQTANVTGSELLPRRNLITLSSHQRDLKVVSISVAIRLRPRPIAKSRISVGTELSTHGKTLRMLVQLFSVAAMHNCVVQVGDGTTTQLKAKPEADVKQIWVNAAVPGAVPNLPRVNISCSMLTADVDPAECCHPDLLTKQDWDFEIELSPDRRLSRFQ
jgi:hypothetical protein